MLTDATGKAYARTGYQAGGPESYIKHLAEKAKVRKERDKNFAAAEKAKDNAEKAKLLDLALSKIEEGGIPVLSNYGATVEQIIKFDSDDKAGLKSKYEGLKNKKLARVFLGELNQKINTKKFAEAIKDADAYLARKGIGKEIKQQVAYSKSYAQYNLKDLKGAIATLEVALAFDPESRVGKQIPGLIKRLSDQVNEKSPEKPGPVPAKKDEKKTK